MKRRTSSLPVQIATYGCRPPDSNVDLFWGQLRAANRYYNTLIEIERNRLQAYRTIRSEHSVDLQELEAEQIEVEALITEARDAIGNVRQLSRKRTEAAP